MRLKPCGAALNNYVHKKVDIHFIGRQNSYYFSRQKI